MVKNSKLLTARQSKDIDIKAREVFGISTLVLMENAGRGVSEEAIKLLRRKEKKVAIFCGKGNNGGDGFVTARHLLTQGIKPDIYLAGSIAEVENEARPNLEILLKLKQRVLEISEENLHLVKNKISGYNLIIDALLGVGLAGEVRGIYRDLIGIINISNAHILSVDIPSGLDATTGRVLGCCVKADTTVTFVAKKRGMLVGDGPKYCGRIVVKDLGIPI
ncbi:MAG: NAD(P)H-hydrate epimerase [Candidatus Omnitrophica bacterium]|nr:NAD(P)H-hydrate epimerase [Candidatus Omnitrophota bacterium]MDD5592245.1 NAD(P)H-hydrate epimerase [Candidatus Omnitrophota bacterium]